MADRYFVSGGDGNYGSTNNWSTTSGGSGGSSVPGSGDAVILDGNSPSSLTINTSTRSALTLTTTGWTGTIVMSQDLQISGAITLSATTAFSGSGWLMGLVAATHTFSGVTIPNLWFRGSVTHTLAANSAAVNVRLGNATNNTVLNGNQLSISGNLDLSQVSSVFMTGTTLLVMTGTGSLLLPSAGGGLQLNLTFNTAGTITIGTGTLRYNTGTMTRTAGTIDASNADLLTTANTTFDVNGINWKTFTVTGTTTVTLSSNMQVTGLVTLGNGSSAEAFNGSTLQCGGGLRYGGTSGVISGTTILELTGTGTLDAPSVTTGRVTNQLKINAPGGTITFDSPFLIDAGQLLYTSGSITTDAGTWASGGGIKRPSGFTGGFARSN